jgi:hypothetical protein
MTVEDGQYIIGRHEAQIASLQEDMREIKVVTTEIREILAEARGRWRLMVGVGGAMAACGALVVKIFDYFGGFHH